VEKRKSFLSASTFLLLFVVFTGLLILTSTLESRFPASAWSQVPLVVVSVGLAAVYLVSTLLTSTREEAQKARVRIEAIEVKAENQPEKAKFAWELASAKLESYFDRNLMQVYSIFIIAIVAMIVGFGFMLWGVWLALRNPGQNTSWIAAISGIITEFIGATFMVIYRSTMAQANAFMQVLERINTVGMAVQILDSIPDSESQLKNSMRAELVNLLFKGITEERK
jgi:nitrate reductase NapE component